MVVPVVQDKRRSVWRHAVVALLASAVVAGAASRSAPVVRGSDQTPAPAADPLGGPYVDVARLPPPSTSGSALISASSSMATGAPDLLVVSPPDPGLPGSIRVGLLQRDAGRWSRDGSLEVVTGLPGAGPGWLVPLGADVALLGVDADAGRTSVALLSTVGGLLRLVASRVVPLAVAQAGAADIDGDGRPELILVRSPGQRLDDGCPGTRLLILDGRTLAVRSDATAAGLRLDGAALGRPGGNDMVLLAYAARVCSGVRGAVRPSEVVAIDLSSGRTIARLGLGTPSSAADAQGAVAPLSVRLTGEAADVVIVRDGRDTVALDHAHHWRRSVLLRNAFPVAFADAPGGTSILTVFHPADQSGDASGGTSAVDLLALSRRTPDGVIVASVVAEAPIAQGLGDAAAGGDAGAEPSPRRASVWTGDLRGDGCRAILWPRVTLLGCAAGGRWTVRPGPAWTGTVPLAAYGRPGGRRLLVAAGLDWSSPLFGLRTPAPAALVDGSAMPWRTGPSGPFALQELDGGDVAYFAVFPSPIIDIDPTIVPGVDPEIVVGGSAGDRVFVRYHALADPAGTVATAPPGPTSAAVGLIPVPLGGTAGANLGAIHLPLPSVEVADVAPGGGLRPGLLQPGAFGGAGSLPAAPITGWQVEAVGVNAYGQVSPLASTRVTLDRTGPNVALSLPLILAPWPFSAPIDGVAEPGARLRLADGPTVEAATNGAFELRAQLAPWPQTLEIHAVDARGNETVRSVSVVGGIDYRQWPWQTILIVVLLLGAALTTWRGPGSTTRLVSSRTSRGWIARSSAGQIGRGGLLGSARFHGNPLDTLRGGFDEVATIEDLPARPSIPR